MQAEGQSDEEHKERARRRRDGAANVFYEDPTLALDYWHEGEERPRPLWRKILYTLSRSKPEDNQRMGIYDLEMVKLHLPTLLQRRNASVSIMTVQPQQIEQNYEQAESTAAPEIVNNTESNSKNDDK